MRVDVALASKIAPGFRSAQIAGTFDLPTTGATDFRASVSLPDITGAKSDWHIGAIVGPSGSGKSQIARKAYADRFIESHAWPDDAASIAAAVRADAFPLRRFVAVTCHYDVLAYLAPCWVLDMADRTLARGWVQPERARRPEWFAGRPPLRFDVVRLDPNAKRRAWAALARHHYLDHSLHRAATAYAIHTAGQPIALCATLHQLGRPGCRRVTRLVVSPDYQGLGLGRRLLDAIADYETHTLGCRQFSIRTSHPALIASLGRSPRWRDLGRSYNAKHAGIARSERRAVGSAHRVTRGFRFRPLKHPPPLN